MTTDVDSLLFTSLDGGICGGGCSDGAAAVGGDGGRMVGQQGQNTTQFDEPILQKLTTQSRLVISCNSYYLKHFLHNYSLC